MLTKSLGNKLNKKIMQLKMMKETRRDRVLRIMKKVSYTILIFCMYKVKEVNKAKKRMGVKRFPTITRGSQECGNSISREDF